MDVHNACGLFGLTGDDSELVRLGIFTEDDERSELDKNQEPSP